MSFKGLDCYSFTRKYKFLHSRCGRQFSGSVEKSSFEKIDRLYNIIGSSVNYGVIDGWSVSIEGDFAKVSSGSGFINGFYSETFEDKSLNLSKTEKNNIYVRIKDGIVYPHLEDLKSFMSELGDEPVSSSYERHKDYITGIQKYHKDLNLFLSNYKWEENEYNHFNVADFFVSSLDNIEGCLLLGHVYFNNKEFHLDTSGVVKIKNLKHRIDKNSVDLLRNHSHEIYKVDLSTDFYGVLPDSHFKNINASLFQTGVFDKSILPDIKHEGLIGKGVFYHSEIDDSLSVCLSGLPLSFASVCLENIHSIQNALEEHELDDDQNNYGDIEALKKHKKRKRKRVYLPPADLTSKEFKNSKDETVVVSMAVDFSNQNSDLPIYEVLDSGMSSLLGAKEVVYDVVCQEDIVSDSKLSVKNYSKSVFSTIDLNRCNETYYFFKTSSPIEVGTTIKIDGNNLEVVGFKNKNIVCKGKDLEIYSDFIESDDRDIGFKSYRKLATGNTMFSKVIISNLKKDGIYYLGDIRIDGVKVLTPTSFKMENVDILDGNKIKPNGENLSIELNESQFFRGLSLEIEMHGYNSEEEHLELKLETINEYGLKWYFTIPDFDKIVPYFWIGETATLDFNLLSDDVKGEEYSFYLNSNEKSDMYVFDETKIKNGIASTELSCYYPDVLSFPMSVCENNLFGCSFSIYADLHSSKNLSSKLTLEDKKVNVNFVSPFNVLGECSINNDNIKKHCSGKNQFFVTSKNSGTIKVKNTFLNKFSLLKNKDVRTLVYKSKNIDDSINLCERLDLYKGIERILSEMIGSKKDDYSVILDEKRVLNDGVLESNFDVDSDCVILVFNIVKDRFSSFIKTDVIFVKENNDVLSFKKDDCSDISYERLHVQSCVGKVYVPVNRVVSDFEKLTIEELSERIGSIKHSVSPDIEKMMSILNIRKDKLKVDLNTLFCKSLLYRDRFVDMDYKTSIYKNDIDLGGLKLIKGIDILFDGIYDKDIFLSSDMKNWSKYDNKDESSLTCRYIRVIFNYSGFFDYSSVIAVDFYNPKSMVIERELDSFDEADRFSDILLKNIGKNNKVFVNDIDNNNFEVFNFKPETIDITNLSSVYRRENVKRNRRYMRIRGRDG